MPIGFRDRAAQRAYLRERLAARARVRARMRSTRNVRDLAYLQARLAMIKRQIKTAIAIVRADADPIDKL